MSRFLCLAAAVAAIAGLAIAAPASGKQQRSADLVEGCHMIVCIDAYTGSKNYSSHTQYLQAVEVFGGSSSGYLEVWGDGFYKKFYYTTDSGIVYINRWVRSGTNVCGAATEPGVPRRIACITIRV